MSSLRSFKRRLDPYRVAVAQKRTRLKEEALKSAPVVKTNEQVVTDINELPVLQGKLVTVNTK